MDCGPALFAPLCLFETLQEHGLSPHTAQDSCGIVL
jgi:hypothetical protein